MTTESNQTESTVNSADPAKDADTAARKARMQAFRSITNALAKLDPKEAKTVLASVVALYAE